MLYRILLRLATFLCLTTSILALCLNFSYAQQDQPQKRAIANVPFDFFVGSQQLPKGRYQIRMTSSSVFVMHNLENKANAQMFTLPEGPPVAAKDSKLVFFLHDGKWVLAGLMGPNG